MKISKSKLNPITPQQASFIENVYAGKISIYEYIINHHFQSSDRKTIIKYLLFT